jgi:hypothetical protein
VLAASEAEQVMQQPAILTDEDVTADVSLTLSAARTTKQFLSGKSFRIGSRISELLDGKLCDRVPCGR